MTKATAQCANVRYQRAFAGKHLMVTGGCGFIGSSLVRRLVQYGPRQVTVLDSMRYGVAENLGAPTAAVRVRPFTLGYGSPAELAESLSGVDCLFHLAAEKHNQALDEPDTVLRANVTGTHDLLVAAARAGVRRCIFSSSLYAYGQMHPPKMSERDVPAPWTVYGASKLAGEHLLRHAERVHGLAGLSLRFFFVYGPRQFPGRGYKSVIVSNFERIARGVPPVVFGDGQQLLDYVYVDDVVEASVAAMASERSGEVFNVGSGSGLSISELTYRMLEVSGSNLPIEYRPPDWTAGTARVADISRIQGLLGWAPQTSITEGLTRTWEWVKQEISR